METIIFRYRESFSKFYRNLGLMETVTENTETESVEKLRNGNSLGLFRPFPEITVLFVILQLVINSVIFRKILNLN
jgi:archaellum biogenesis protein FlaJ (TadC family)